MTPEHVFRQGRADSWWYEFQGQYLLNGPDGDLTAITFPVTPCNDGSFCCGNGTVAGSCCRQGNGLFVVDGEARRKNPASFQDSTVSRTASATSSSSSRKSKTTSPASSPTLSTSLDASALTASASRFLSTTTSEAISEKKPSSKTGAIVGGVIGGVAVLALVAGVVLFLKRHNRRQRQSPAQEAPFQGDKAYQASEAPAYEARREMDAANPLLPMDSSRMRHEMQ